MSHVASLWPPLPLRCAASRKDPKHNLTAVCGESCRPQSCVACWNKVEDCGLVEAITALTIQATEEKRTPSISLSCGHTFSVSYLHNAVGLDQVYSFEDGTCFALKSPTVGLKQTTCPTCSTPFWSPRYGRLIKAFNLKRQVSKKSLALSRQIGLSHRLMMSERGYWIDELRQAIGSASPWRDNAMPSLGELNSILRLSPDDTDIVDAQLFNDVLEVFKIDGPIKGLWQQYAGDLCDHHTALVKAVNSPADFLRVWDQVYAMRVMAGAGSKTAQEDAMRAMGALRPDSFVVDRVHAIIRTVQLRVRLLALARDFEHIIRYSPPAIGSTRSETKVYVEVVRTAARRFGILGWAIIRSCRRDIDLAINTLDSLVRHREGQPRVTSELDDLWLLRAKLECWAIYCHMEWAKQVHVTRVVELSDGKGAEEVRQQAVTGLDSERARGVYRWERLLAVAKAGYMRRRHPQEYGELDAAFKKVKEVWEETGRRLAEGQLSLDVSWQLWRYWTRRRGRSRKAGS